MNDYFSILFETIRIEFRMFFARPTVPVASVDTFNRSSNAKGERTHTTSRCAWN